MVTLADIKLPRSCLDTCTHETTRCTMRTFQWHFSLINLRNYRSGTHRLLAECWSSKDSFQTSIQSPDVLRKMWANGSSENFSTRHGTLKAERMHAKGLAQLARTMIFEPSAAQSYCCHPRTILVRSSHHCSQVSFLIRPTARRYAMPPLPSIHITL